jgi:hypothetical protein
MTSPHLEDIRRLATAVTSFWEAYGEENPAEMAARHDQAGLRVVFERGSWLATWIRLEEPTFQPDTVRRQLLAITQSADGTLRYRDLAAA